MKGDASYSPAMRLRSPADFERVFARRCSAGDDLLVVYGCRNELAWSRLGLSVSRKFGGAVTRNRCKRRLREAFRLSRQELPTGMDLVVIPRAGPEPDFARLRDSLVKLATRVVRKLERQGHASHA